MMSGISTLLASACVLASIFTSCNTWMQANPAEVQALETEAVEAGEAVVKIVAPNLIP